MKTRIFKLVLGVLITLLSFSVNAQDYEYIPLVKPGLQLWTCDKGYYGHNDEAYRFKRFALTDEDTIIDNETYKKLYFYRDVEFDTATATYIGALRENSQKQVFYRGLNGYRDMDDSPYGIQELNEMIYDFSLSVGDTFSGGSLNMSSAFMGLVVANIDTINYNGVERRRFKIMTEGYGQTAAIWIEGIGNREGLFFPYHTNTGDFWGNTRCYTYNGELQYHNYSDGINDCITPLMGVESIVEDNSITLYPNPTNSEVNISSQNIINSIEIYNSLGQRVYQSVVNSNTKTIDISSFSNGVYILGVITDNGVIRKKIIKN
jgi:hypothetical protein